jgi:hypothetical protein
MRKMANPTSYRNFAPQHSKKMVAPRICNTFAMGNNWGVHFAKSSEEARKCGGEGTAMHIDILVYVHV